MVQQSTLPPSAHRTGSISLLESLKVSYSSDSMVFRFSLCVSSSLCLISPLSLWWPLLPPLPLLSLLVAWQEYKEWTSYMSSHFLSCAFAATVLLAVTNRKRCAGEITLLSWNKTLHFGVSGKCSTAQQMHYLERGWAERAQQRELLYNQVIVHI